MPRYPRLSPTEAERLLCRNGFVAETPRKRFVIHKAEQDVRMSQDVHDVG